MAFANIMSKIGSAVKSGSDFLVRGVKKGANLTTRALGKIGNIGAGLTESIAEAILPESVNRYGREVINRFNPFVSVSRQREVDAAPSDVKKLEASTVDSVFGELPPGFVEIDEPVPNGFVEYVLPDGKSIWRRTNQRLQDLIDKKITSSNKSDEMTLTLNSDIGIPRRYVKRMPKEAKSTENQGAWFPYLLKDEVPMDLRKYGIFKKNQVPKVVDNCLLHIFKDHPKFDTLATVHYGSYTSQSEMKKICSLLKVRIILYKYRSGLRRSISYGEEGPTYHIALACNHYFKFEMTEYKAAWVKKAAWSKESKGLKSSDVRKSSPFMNSLQLVVEIFKQKDKYLDDFSSEIYAWHYQSKYDIDVTNPKFDLVNDAVPYDGNKALEHEQEQDDDGEDSSESQKAKIPFSDVFYADIETNTSHNHEPYMFCLVNEENEEKWCWKGSDCVDHALRKLQFCKRPLIYFHNLGYDSKFIVDKLFRPSTIDISSSKCVSLSGYVGKTKLTFHDTYAFLSCPLSSFSEMFDLEEGKYVDFPHSFFKNKTVTDVDTLPLNTKTKKFIPVEYHDVERKVVNHMRYAEDYCLRDVYTLKRGFSTFKKWIREELDIDIDDLLTTASLAHYYLNQQGCYEGVYKIGGVTRAYMQKAVIGGRTMISLDENYKKVVKKCKEEIYDFDAVSLYPSAMMRMDGSPLGAPKRLSSNEKNIDSLNRFDDYFVTIRISKVGKKSKLPCMSKLGEDGSRIWTNEMEGEVVVVNKLTLEDYVRFHEIEFEVIDGLKFDEGFNTKIVETMKKIFELRLKLKKDKNPAEKVYKLIMNSAYGKTIEKPHNMKTHYIIKDKFLEFMRKNCGSVTEVYEMERHYRVKCEASISRHYTLPQVGNSVLAMSKRIMNEVFEIVEDDVYYTDTDSMFITTSGLKKLCENKPDIVGNRPMQFHVDFEMSGDNVRGIEAMFLAPKTYCVKLTNDAGEIDYHYRMKGISKNAIEDKIKNFDSPYHMYEKLTEEQMIFDLLAGDKVRFEFLGDLNVRTLKDFRRSIGPFPINC